MRWTKSKLWFNIVLALVATHVIVVLSVVILRIPFGLERLNDVVIITTVYLPLVPWQLAEVPVLQATAQLIRPPNALGWVIVVLTWMLFYVVVGYASSVLLTKVKSREVRS